MTGSADFQRVREDEIVDMLLARPENPPPQRQRQATVSPPRVPRHDVDAMATSPSGPFGGRKTGREALGHLMSLVITIVLLGLLASVSPSTIVVFILLLATTRARVNAAAFLIGWSVSLVIVFAVSYAAGGALTTQGGSSSTAVEVIEILLGAALAFAAGRQWRRRDRPRTSSGVAKKFTARLKKLKPWEAAIVGVLEQPWTLTAAAAVVLVRHHSAFLIVVIAFLAFTLLSTATIGLIFLYFARRPGQAEARLSELRDRLVEAGPAIFAVVSLVVGIFLIIDGAIGIVGG